jgi:hypothetical protein
MSRVIKTLRPSTLAEKADGNIRIWFAVTT